MIFRYFFIVGLENATEKSFSESRRYIRTRFFRKKRIKACKDILKIKTASKTTINVTIPFLSPSVAELTRNFVKNAKATDKQVASTEAAVSVITDRLYGFICSPSHSFPLCIIFFLLLFFSEHPLFCISGLRKIFSVYKNVVDFSHILNNFYCWGKPVFRP